MYISNAQLEIENYKILRRDRAPDKAGGGCLVYIANHVNSVPLKILEVPEIEGIWLKITFDSTALVLGTIYRPPSNDDFFNHFLLSLEKAWLKHKNVLIVGDLNCDVFHRNSVSNLSSAGIKLLRLLDQVNFSVVNDQPTRVSVNTSTLIDLVITNKPELITTTKTLELGISDHMLVYASLRIKVKRPPCKIVRARSFRRFNCATFMQDLENAPWSLCSVFDDPGDCYWAWQNIFNDICDNNAPFREVKLRQHSLPWITPQIRHKMYKRFQTLLKAKASNYPVLWSHSLMTSLNKLRNVMQIS